MKKPDPKYLPDDQKLVAAAKKDRAVFSILYEKYFEKIFHFVYKRVGDEDATGDITQEAMLKAMFNLNKYEDRGVPFTAWLYRIASNEVNLYFRAKKKNFTVEIEEKHVKSILEEVKSGDAMSLEDQEKLVGALNNLEPEHAEIIDLRFFMQYSFKEIADFYNITEANAKMRLYRILDKVKKDWK